jgi:lysophospholipase L1-like esterase
VDYVGPYNGVGDDFEYNKSDPDTYIVPESYQELNHTEFPDQDMAGDTGWRIDKFLETWSLPADKLVEDYDPDYVIIHLGTNNLGSRSDTPEQTIDKMGQLIDLLRDGDATNPNRDTKIYVAQIIPLLDDAYGLGPGEYQLVIDFNALLPDLIAQKNQNSNHTGIILVDMWTEFNHTTMLAEKTHPNDLGDRQIAAKWFATFASDLNLKLIPPGDVDSNYSVDLSDAVLAMQVLSDGEMPALFNQSADINSDQKVGLEEAIYILQELSGKR